MLCPCAAKGYGAQWRQEAREMNAQERRELMKDRLMAWALIFVALFFERYVEGIA